LSDADEAIEVAIVKALDNPDGGIVGGAECDAEGKNERIKKQRTLDESRFARQKRGSVTR
jgi:hypothetical protein